MRPRSTLPTTRSVDGPQKSCATTSPFESGCRPALITLTNGWAPGASGWRPILAILPVAAKLSPCRTAGSGAPPRRAATPALRGRPPRRPPCCGARHGDRSRPPQSRHTAFSHGARPNSGVLRRGSPQWNRGSSTTSSAQTRRSTRRYVIGLGRGSSLWWPRRDPLRPGPAREGKNDRVRRRDEDLRQRRGPWRWRRPGRR
jgi:hypothetical protein